MNLKRGGRRLSGLALILAVASGAWAASEKVLYAFQGTDGSVPTSVIIGPDGALYGTTVAGGANSCGGNGCGVVFRLTQGADGKWDEMVLHDFAGSDGQYPNGALVADKAGNLYGTTVYGGSSCSDPGCGVVFELVRGSAGEWTFEVLHNFALTDGANPYAGMTFDSKGNLYGTTSLGGNTSECNPPEGCGVVFEMTDANGAWTETMLYSFLAKDGALPYAPLTLDADRNLYGTTEWGGAYDAGTVFKLSPRRHGQWNEEVLHSFSSDTKDGGQPTYGVIFDGLGNLYGATTFGGTEGQQGWGTAFRLTPEKNGKWKETVLRTFDRAKAGGGFVSSGVILDAGGNLYGSTGSGGKCNNCGVVFKLTPRAKGNWGDIILHSFEGNDGEGPGGGLVFDSAGRLLGVTHIGGNTGGPCGQGGCGVVYEITP
jgi:uncharacterized repeat protein (TIGR03803 family)